MSITKADFDKIWGVSSSVPTYTFADADYADGWEFVGNLPPTRAMWDTLQRRNDQKTQYLAQYFGDVVSVAQYGAKGDGTTDDTTAIQSAIDHVASVGGGTVYFPKGDYVITDTINVNDSNVKLVGEGNRLAIIRPSTDLIIDSATNNVKWSVMAENVNTPVVTSLSAVASAGDTTIAVTSATGIEAGMLVYLRGTTSESPWTTQNSTTPSIVKGETNRVLSVSGTTITLQKPLSDSWDATEITTLTVTFVKPLVGIQISNLGVSSPNNAEDDGRNYRGFAVKGCVDAVIDSCYGYGCGISCYESYYSYKSKLNNNVVENCWSYKVGTTTNNGLGYGLRCTGDSLSEIVNNIGDECRHCVDISGDYPSHGVVVANNNFAQKINTYGVISTHEPAEGCLFINNIVKTDGTSLNIRGESIVIKNNYIEGNAYNENGRNNEYTGNTFKGYIIFTTPYTNDKNNYIIVKNNVFHANASIYFESNSNISASYENVYGLIVQGNINFVNVSNQTGMVNVSNAGVSPVIFEYGFIFKDNYEKNAQGNLLTKSLFVTNMTNATIGHDDFDPIATDTYCKVQEPSNAVRGETEWRTRLYKPTWYNGTKWVDANGKQPTLNASVAPTSGTYERGAIVWNTQPTAGGYIGWICVTAGTPGTWKGFGAIEA